jgi:hypothetical protein
MEKLNNVLGKLSPLGLKHRIFLLSVLIALHDGTVFQRQEAASPKNSNGGRIMELMKQLALSHIIRQ